MTIQEQLPIPMELAFRVSPRTMRMLGRENISSPVISVLELVKNAYDADASRVEIIFENTSSPDGYIVIADDGVGMDLQALQENWMVISTDNKVHSPLTAKGRRKVGEKGIGRLAMDRLARQATIVTYRDNAFGLELMIDWDKYEQDYGQLNEIKHPLHSVPAKPDGKSGTTLYLSQLRDIWARRDYETLYNDLALLIPPFSQEISDFSIYFSSTETPDLSGEIVNPLEIVAEYSLTSTLSSDGEIHHVALHRSGETTEDKHTWHEVFPSHASPTCGQIRVELKVYLRDSQSLKDTGIKLAELRQFLKQFSGVRIYRDGFRVKPYGDQENGDWLGLNARYTRIRRLPEGQIVGAVFITRYDNPFLQDQTNREGLIDNDAYKDMRNFLLHGINFLDELRAQQLKNKPQKTQQATIPETLSNSETKLNSIALEIRKVAKVIGPISPESESLLKLAGLVENVVAIQIKESQAAYEAEQEEIALQQTEFQLMIGLSTLGIAITAFGHEISRVINNVKGRANLLTNPVKILPEHIKKQAEKDLNILIESAEQVQAWGKFALDRVRQDKRTRQNIDLNKIVCVILQEFEVPFAREHVEIEAEITEGLPPFRAFAMDLEAIVINFITNAKEAMRYQPLDQRKIRVRTDYNRTIGEFEISFADSGRGIRSEDEDRIFNPFFSTKTDREGKPIGTGMGLTIVKNVVDSYNGRITVKGHGKLGGAEFHVYLPHQTGGRNDRS